MKIYVAVQILWDVRWKRLEESSIVHKWSCLIQDETNDAGLSLSERVDGIQYW